MNRSRAWGLSLTDEHYTPPEITDRAREVMGGIDLDPASCEQANQWIKASAIYTESDNGLAQPWLGRVFLNPPGGVLDYQGKRVSKAGLWYATLAHRFDIGEVEQAVFLIFNPKFLIAAQRFAVRQPLDFPFCILRNGMRYIQTDGQPSGSTSPHACIIVYMGPNVDTFRRVFGDLGWTHS